MTILYIGHCRRFYNHGVHQTRFLRFHPNIISAMLLRHNISCLPYFFSNLFSIQHSLVYTFTALSIHKNVCAYCRIWRWSSTSTCVRQIKVAGNTRLYLGEAELKSFNHVYSNNLHQDCLFSQRHRHRSGLNDEYLVRLHITIL